MLGRRVCQSARGEGGGHGLFGNSNSSPDKKARLEVLYFVIFLYSMKVSSRTCYRRGPAPSWLRPGSGRTLRARAAAPFCGDCACALEILRCQQID